MAASARAQGQTVTPKCWSSPLPPGSGLDLYNLPNAGLQIGILVLGSLAVLFMSSEYATGMIRSTMNAVPRRTPAFVAKAIILAVISYVITTVAAVRHLPDRHAGVPGPGLDL